MSIFSKAVDSFSADPSNSTMRELVDLAEKETLMAEEIKYLAETLSRSGKTISFHSDKEKVDIASTGGPSSLSTLLCPLYLSILGANVIKLGVPGRPAGGIDVLMQIPGYKGDLTPEEVERVIRSCTYAHFLAGPNQAPLDAMLFNFRKRVGALDIPALVISSLLSKKIAVGLTRVGLDVRVSDFGNFGTNWKAAKKNSIEFCKVAKELGLKATCFLTDGNLPYQEYIGRKEALVGLHKIFTGQADNKLVEHNRQCFLMAKSTLNINRVEQPSEKTLADIFAKNLTAQGASFSAFEEIANNLDREHAYKVYANSDGFLNLNLQGLRNTLVKFQNHSKTNSCVFPDPCGVILRSRPDSYFKKGECLATYRITNKNSRDIQEDLNLNFRIGPKSIFKARFEEVQIG